MKLKVIGFFSAISFLLVNCGNDKAATTESKFANSSSTEKSVEQAPAANSSGNDILGTWKLVLDAFDHNSNQVLEDEERKKGIPNNYSLQLNADGTCRIQNTFNGTYTIKDEGGKKILTVQRKRIEAEEKEDPLPDIFHIKSLTKDELILLLVDAAGSSTFWIFKRVR